MDEIADSLEKETSESALPDEVTEEILEKVINAYPTISQ